MDRFSKLLPMRILETRLECSAAKLSIQLYICKQRGLSDWQLSGEGVSSKHAHEYHLTFLIAFLLPLSVLKIMAQESQIPKIPSELKDIELWPARMPGSSCPCGAVFSLREQSVSSPLKS